MTPLQQRFVAEYVKDLNATAAIERAGSRSGRPRQAASELLRNPEVLAAIDSELQHGNHNSGIDAVWWATRVQSLSETDFAEIYLDNRLLPPSEWPLAWRTGRLTGFRRKLDAKGNALATGIRQLDGLRLLALLGDHVGAWKVTRRRAGSSRRTIAVDPQQIPAVRKSGQQFASGGP